MTKDLEIHIISAATKNLNLNIRGQVFKNICESNNWTRKWTSIFK